MRRSIATVCLSGTLEDKLAAAAAAGFDGVEIFENDLIASPSAPERIRERCAQLGLTIELYQPFRDFEAVGPEAHLRHLRRAERKFDLMERLGAPMMLVCSSVLPESVDDDDLAAGQLHALADRAAGRGLRIAYEALAWGRHISTWEHSAEIVRRGDHPALGMCLDSFHVLSRGGDLAGLTAFPGEKLFFLQLADAPRLAMDVLQWSRHYRLFPGQGSFDLAAFVGRVLSAGYRGPLSLEVFNDVFRQSAPDRAAVDAMRSLVALEEELRGRRHPAVLNGADGADGADGHGGDGGDGGAGRERIRLADPPPAPEPDGYAFAELAVDGVSGPEVARVLAAMGFAHIGQHRSKPVQLWQQGTARVLLNSGNGNGNGNGNGSGDGGGGDLGSCAGTSGGTATAAAGERAAVSAFAVETADPARSARRAEQLLAPVLDRSRGPAEADLTSVAAPDGTRVFFCRTGAEDTESWLGDFILTAPGQPPPTGLTGIDHIALAQPFDSFDEATLFYRSLLGLDPRHDAEYAAPFGLVHTRAVSDAGGRIRIVLDGTVLRRGTWTPGVPDPQHIAFVTDDIFTSTRTMRERGAPLLAVSDNYYDDLDARLALDPEMLAAMRACHVLYDRDEHGEFLHAYTVILGSRVFFEVVQRVGGYTGYGAVNAPVRMAAHRAERGTRPPGER